MKDINIAKILVEKRKEKGITQEELAVYIGVTKASVSKWETGQSYPDITFLPQLATYFNISVDDLIGYIPLMRKEDIKKLYHRLTVDFSSKPFEEVLAECRSIIKKYYSCFPLLMQMAVLFINHYMLAKNKETQEIILEEVIDLCQRIKTENENVWMLNEANSLEAIAYLILQDSEQVLKMLDGTMKPTPSNEAVLASAYQMAGNIPKAKEVLQAGIYHHLLEMMGIIPSYLLLNQDHPHQFEEVLNRTISMAEIFELDQLQPGIVLPIYLVAAQSYAIQNNTEIALDMLGKYSNLCKEVTFPITLHGDQFFDSLEGWFAEFDLGTQAPRDEKVIKQSMLQGMENPAFASLREHARYKSMVETLKIKLGEY